MVTADEARLLQGLQAIAGPLVELNAREEVGAWWWAGSRRGREVQFGLSCSGVLNGVTFRIPLGGREIAFRVSDHRTTILGVPTVTTGDPAFDARFRVHAQPPGLGLAALDEATRAWLSAAFPEHDPQLGTSEGRLEQFLPLRATDGTFALDHAVVPPPEVLAQCLDGALWFADRLIAAHDGLHAQILATQGPEAAARWLADLQAARRDRERGRRRLRWAILGIVLGVVVIPPLVVLWALLR